MDWRGIKIIIEVMVLNRNCTVTVVPTASPLIIKALKEGPRDRKKTKNVKHNGNLKMNDVVEIAKKLKLNKKSYAKEFKGLVKEVVGTCTSIGCTIDGKKPKDICPLIDAGEIEINE